MHCDLHNIQMQYAVHYLIKTNTYVVGILNFCMVAMPFDSMHDSIVIQLLLVG